MNKPVRNAIHQLYCTCCTYGTSYLHQRDGAVKDQAFEHSARAGSVPRETSHDYFRRFETCMSYRLPADTPNELLLELSATDTDPRLIYYPSIGGLRMLAQIRYRTTDTQGRPGSYFAHVLFSEEQADQAGRTQPGDAPSHSATFLAADCLALWGSSGWMHEEQDVSEFQLMPLSTLSDLNVDEPPAISTDVLDAFLRLPAKDGAAPDPFEGRDFGQVIPDRWRRKEPPERQQLLVDTLRGFLKLDVQKRETMLLAVEPSVAALVFYGVAKLLPSSGIGEQLSFSTLEPHTARPSTALAATTFYNPESPDAELPAAAYKSHGLAINTYTGKRSVELPRLDGPLDGHRRADAGSPPDYAEMICREWITKGADFAIQLVEAAHQAGKNRQPELEGLAKLCGYATGLLSGARRWESRWSKDNADAAFVRRAMVRELALQGQQTIKVDRLAASPWLMQLIESIILEKNCNGFSQAIDRLLSVVAIEQVPQVLSQAEITSEQKAKLIARLSRAYGLQSCGNLWSEAKTSREAASILFGALRELSAPEIESKRTSIPSREQSTFLGILAYAAGSDAAKRQLFSDLFVTADERLICQVLLNKRWCKTVLEQLAGNQDFDRRVNEIAESLPEHHDRIALKIHVLRLVADRLSPQNRQLAQRWWRLRVAVQGLVAEDGNQIPNTFLEKLQEIQPQFRELTPASFGELRSIVRGLSGNNATFEPAWDRIKRVVMPRMIEVLDGDRFEQFLTSELMCEYPNGDPQVARRLVTILDSIADQPHRFQVIVTLLESSKHLLPSSAAGRVEAWGQIHDGLQSLATLRMNQPKLFESGFIDPRVEGLSEISKQIGIAIQQALPARGERQRQVVYAIAQSVLGDNVYSEYAPLRIPFEKQLKRSVPVRPQTVRG